MKKSLQLACVYFVCLTSSVQAEIYHCKDASGATVFSDRECDSHQQLVEHIETVKAENPSPGETRLAPSNLVLNPGFENGEAQWVFSQNTNWNKNRGRYTSAGLSIQAAKPPEDKYIHETTVEQCIRLNNADSYMWTAEVRLQGMPLKAHANRANIIWYRSENCSTGGQWGAYLEPKSRGGWQKLRGRPLTPAMGAKSAKLTLVQNGRFSNAGTAFWDNIEFYPLGDPARPNSPSSSAEEITFYEYPAGGNILLNGSFSEYLNQWRKSNAAEWDENTGKQRKGSVRTIVASDKGSLGRGVLSQCVELAKQRQYSLRAYVKVDRSSTQSGGGRLRATWNTKLDCRGQSQIATKHADFNDSLGWQELTVNDLIAPDEAVAVTVELIQRIQGKGLFVVNWDDVELVVE